MSSWFFFLPTILFLKSYCMYIFYNSTSCSWCIIQYLLNYFYAIAIFGPFPQSPGKHFECNQSHLLGLFRQSSETQLRLSRNIYYLSRNIYYWSYIHQKSMDGASNDACAFARLDCWMLPSGNISWGNKSSYKLYSPHNHATNFLPY